MKHPAIFRPRAVLLIGAALVSTPALAQQGSTVTPPQVVPTVPQAEQVTPPPPTVTPPRLVPTMVQQVPDTPEPQAEPRAAREPAQPRRTATTTVRSTPRTAERSPRALTPAEARAPVAEAAPVEAPVAEAPPPVPVAAPEPAPAAVETVQAEQTVVRSAPIWPWLVGGALLALAALAFVLFRRRSEYDEFAEEYVEEPVSAEPVVAAPIVAPSAPPRHEPEVAPRVMAAAPVLADETPVVTADEAVVEAADADDLAGIAAGAAPVSHRPWLELGLRPVRAGTLIDEALVEVELIVGNSGDMAAENVRISTFMLPNGSNASDMEALLLAHANDPAVDPVSIAPGEGKCVDTTLHTSRADLEAQGDTFSPLLVADARYRLPDGSEGRTSATFRIGISDDNGGALEPIALGERNMHHNVGAELEGVTARV